MTETSYLSQFRPTEHEPWRDDNFRYDTPEKAEARAKNYRESKIMRGAKIRIIKRTDEEVIVEAQEKELAEKWAKKGAQST